MEVNGIIVVVLIAQSNWILKIQHLPCRDVRDYSTKPKLASKCITFVLWVIRLSFSRPNAAVLYW